MVRSPAKWPVWRLGRVNSLVRPSTRITGGALLGVRRYVVDGDAVRTHCARLVAAAREPGTHYREPRPGVRSRRGRPIASRSRLQAPCFDAEALPRCWVSQ